MKFPEKIPVLFGLLAVLFFVVIIAAIESITREKSTAHPSVEPKNVMVTNISDSSFTIIWKTDEKATGMVTVKSKTGKKFISYDDRDIIGTTGSYAAHSVTVRLLTPDTTYDVFLLSKGVQYPKKPYEVRTAPAINAQITNLEPAYGSIITTADQPADGALVTLEMDGSQLLSSLVKPSGTWLIPLNLIKTESLDQFLPVSERMTETITVTSGTEEINALTDTLNDAPVPQMILGNTYDFRKQEAQKKIPASVLGTQTTAVTGKLEITSPQNNADLTTNLPLFAGTGVAQKSITITIAGQLIQNGTTLIGGDGLWRFTPTKSLTPGKYHVTATSFSTASQPIAVTNNFQILKSGTQVLGDATPSATPTIFASGSAAPSPTYSATPSAAPTTIIVIAEPPPTSGSSVPTILLVVIGIIILLGGTLTLAL